MDFNLPQTRAKLEHQRLTAEAALHALGAEIELANRKREICRTNLIAIQAQLGLLAQISPLGAEPAAAVPTNKSGAALPKGPETKK